MEDGPDAVRLMREMFGAVNDGRLALECAPSLSAWLLRLVEGGIDLVLLNLSLADSQGLEALTSIHARATHVPIIVLSGSDDRNLSLKAVNEGAQDYRVQGIFDGNLLSQSIQYAIARKRTEEDLQREHNLLRTVIRTLPDQFFVKDRDSRFLLCNVASARALGVAEPDDLTGKTDFDFFPPEVAAEYFHKEQEIMATGRPMLECSFPRLDGPNGGF